MPRRVAVFIDYQNCYKAAREAFHDPDFDPSHLGTFDPWRLAASLASKGPGGYQLVKVAVFCGIASSTRQPKTFGARRRQIAEWQRQHPQIEVHTRPLKYPPQPAPPYEKGVDVQLAVAAVLAAVSGAADEVIIASCDTDLDPVVEAIVALPSPSAPSVAAIAWRGRDNKLSKHQRLQHRWIGDLDYRQIQDRTDYVREHS